MRRKAGSLIPLEAEILEASIGLRAMGLPEVHGFLIAREIGDRRGADRLTAYGTLYKALDRLERAGLLESRWEEPIHAAQERRPRRRYYRITGAGEAAAADWARARAEGSRDAAPSRKRPAVS